MSFATFLSGFIFGSIGFWLIRFAKQKGNFAHGFIGVALMFYPYFIENPWFNWGLGFALCGLAYELR